MWVCEVATDYVEFSAAKKKKFQLYLSRNKYLQKFTFPNWKLNQQLFYQGQEIKGLILLTTI